MELKNAFIKKFKEFVFHQQIFEVGDRVLVGVSGGADSVCLTHLLMSLKSYQLQLQLVHVNYHLRDEDANADEGFVREFALKYHLPLEVVDFPLKKRRDKLKFSEDELRNFRFEVFDKLAKKFDCQKVALGHHQDDRIETFFINLFRGTGVAGLSSIQVKNSKSYIRPLLFTDRRHIETFLAEIDQEFCIDKTNLAPDFLRNKIRLELLPLIEREYSPKIRERVNTLSQMLAGSFQVLEEFNAERFKSLVHPTEKNNGWWINLSDYLGLDVYSRGLLFRKIVGKIVGNLKNVNQRNFLELEKIVKSQKSKKKFFELAGVVVVKDKKRLVFFDNSVKI